MSREEIVQELMESIRAGKRQSLMLPPDEEAKRLVDFYKALIKYGLDKNLAREILIVVSAK